MLNILGVSNSFSHLWLHSIRAQLHQQIHYLRVSILSPLHLKLAHVCSFSHAHHPTWDVCRNGEQVSLTVETPTCVLSSTYFSDHEGLNNAYCPYVFKSILSNFQIVAGSAPLFLAEWKLDSLWWGEGL